MDDLELHDLTAAYALDALDAHEAEAYEKHLAGCDRCREELARLAPTAASLAYAAAPKAPPPELRGRILDAARAERTNVVPLRPRSTRGLAAVAAVAACAAVGLGVWDVSLHRRLDRAREPLHAVPVTGAKGSVVVGAGGRSALVLTGLAPAPAGKTYEAWVMQGRTAAPAGLFRGGATTVVQLSRRVPHGARVGVTVEPARGSAAPTSTPIVTSAPV